MLHEKEMLYSDYVRYENAKEHPNYFMCGEKSVPALVKKAEKEAQEVLSDFLMFYTGDIDIVIGVKEHDLCYSITATLTVNGKPVKTEDPCDLLFLELNNMVLDRMLKSGFVSFDKGGNAQ